MTKNFTKLRDNLREEIDHKALGPMIDSFTSFASDHLGIESLPNVNLRAAEDIGTSFGGYNPSDNSITLITKNRHPLDVMRTLAHELVHHRQNEEGRINDVAQEGSDGSEIENEANSRAGIMMRQWGRNNPDHFKMSYVTEEFLNEGINDPGIFKVVFLAGGPGSGKDFILQNIVEGNGLVEVNSDNAFEFLMKKGGLDLMMPQSETAAREKVRGRAKNVTKEKEKLALQGRLGLVINGTADDLEKISGMKQRLEDMGYDAMMVFVDTSDEVSRQRNFDRGKGGGRKIPDGTDANGVPDGSPNIRLEKWIEAQRNKDKFEELFGKQSFIRMDNSADLRTAPPAVAEQVQKEFLKAFKKVQKFSTEKPEKPQAKQWIKAEKERLSMQVYASPKRYTYGQNVKPLRPPVEGTIPGFQMTNTTELAQQQVAAKNAPRSQPAATIDQTTPQQQQALTTIRRPVSSVPVSGENDQANAMGLSYYGFGRYGKTINGQNVVTHISKNGRLIPKQRTMSETVAKTYEKMISEVLHMETPHRSVAVYHHVIKADTFNPVDHPNHKKVFETNTHDYYFGKTAGGDHQYVAVNKKTGKADVSVIGSMQVNQGEGNQTFSAGSLEGRIGSPLKAHKFYRDIMTHPHNGGRATIMQSDWMQLTGGKKTWERLAKSPGVAMHTYEPKEGATDFNPKTDPEMIWSTGKTEFDPEVNALLQSNPIHQWGTPEMVKLYSKQKEADTLEKKIGPRRLVAFHRQTMDDVTQGLKEGEEFVKMSKKGKVKRRLVRTIDEDLRQWFKEKWVNIAKPKEGGGYEECGTSGGSSGYAKCVPAAKAGRMSKKQIQSAVRRKRKAQAAAGKPGKNQDGQGNKPIMVKTLKEENSPTNPQLWNQWKQKAKQKFDVYPSAYANAWAAKGYKAAGGGWRKVSKKVDEDFTLFAEEHGAGDWGTDELTYNYLNGTPGEEKSAKGYKKRIRRKKLTQEAVPLGYEFGNNGIGDEFGVVRSPTGLGFGYSIPMSESAEKGVFDNMGVYSGRGDNVDEQGIPLSRYKKKIDRHSDFEKKTFDEEKSPAWQRKEGQDPEGGLNKKGVAAYRRANPGSKLQTAVTTPPSELKKGSKKAKRRLSFCRRMKGMKAKLTSAETARDPDSRINKALRKWNC